MVSIDSLWEEFTVYYSSIQCIVYYSRDKTGKNAGTWVSTLKIWTGLYPCGFELCQLT